MKMLILSVKTVETSAVATLTPQLQPLFFKINFHNIFDKKLFLPSFEKYERYICT